MNWGSVPDWLSSITSIITAVVAGVAAYYGIRTFQHQRTSYDVSLSLDIFRDINGYWNRITEDPSSYDYNIGKILAHFELAATLFNKRVLTKNALPILKDHIIEVFTRLSMDENAKRLIDSCCSSRGTFSELQAFLKTHLPTALAALEFQNEKRASPELVTTQAS